MRAAIYARYSSNLQSKSSIEDQVRLCRARIESEGWDLAQTYSDMAKSGATTLRSGYQNLLHDIREGKFEIVVSEALDRLSRDQENIARLYKELCFAEVRLITLAEGEINELHVGLKGTMNALYLKDLAQKTRRGMEGRVRQGRMAGGISYGYQVQREFDANGEPVRGKRRIDETKAAIVRRIFEAFASGRSPRAIASDLNEDTIPSPSGRVWSDATIRGNQATRSGILRNELYISRLIWNRQSHVTDPRTNKRVARLNPESEWIIKEVPDLRIIDQDLWDRVHSRFASIRNSAGVDKARRTKFWLNRRPRHLLTGLVYCGSCGKKFSAVGRDYLACGAARSHGNCDNRRSIRRTTLQSLILDGLKGRLMHPELVKVFVQEFHAEINRQQQGKDVEHELQRRQFVQINKKYDGLIDAIADGLRTPGLKAKLEQLENEKANLEKKLDAAPPSTLRLHPNLAEVYRRKVENLHEALADPKSHDEALDILRSLIDKVVVHPNDAGFDIELVGAIASMVQLGNGDTSPNPANMDDITTRSVKVAAGAGFKPARAVSSNRNPCRSTGLPGWRAGDRAVAAKDAAVTG